MKPGDPITVIDGGLLVHVRVVSCTHPSRRIICSRKGMAGTVAGPVLEPSDEHVTWVRGHVTEHSADGAALLAAAAMKPSRAMDLKQAEDLCRSGVITVEEWRRNLDLWDSELAAGVDVR